MCRTRSFLWAARYLAALCVFVVFPTLAQSDHPLALEDLLALEALGAVQISPDGRFVAFEHIPGLSSRRDFGLSSGKYEARVLIYDSKGSANAERVVLGDAVAGEWLGPMAPDGRRVLLYWREGTLTRAGFYSFVDRRIEACTFHPAIDFGLSEPIWISESELLHAASTDGSPPLAVEFLRHSARRLAQSWERAWNGRLPTADVLTSAADLTVNNETTVLLRVNADTCDTRLVAEGKFFGLSLSPTKEYVVGARRVGSLPQGREIRRSAHEGVWRYEPYLLNLKASTVPTSLCVGCDVLPSSFQWGVRGEALIYFFREPKRSWETGLFRLYRPRSGRTVDYPHVGLDLVSQREHGHLAVPELAVPLASGIAVAARPTGESSNSPKFSDREFGVSQRGRVDWYLLAPNNTPQNLTSTLKNVSSIPVALRSNGLIVSADGGFYRTEPELKHVATMGKEVNLTVEFHDDTVDARPLYSASIAAVTPGESVAVRTFRETGKLIAEVGAPQGAWTLAALTTNGRAAVFRSVAPATKLALATAGRVPEFIWESNDHLKKVRSAQEVYVSYRLADGTEARSCALLPPDSYSVKSAPTIVHVYPGQGRCWRLYRDGVSYPYEPELLASLGYIVLFPFAPPEKLRTEAGPLSNWGGVVEPALNALHSAGYGRVDRVGAFGMSYGAVSTLALLTQTSRIRAAVASNGLSNFTSHYGTLGLVRRVMPQDLFAVGQSLQYESRGSYLWMESTPWERPADYVAASPIFRVDKIHTPLLLVHSDLDWNYPMEEFDQVYVSLFRLGRDVQYVRYWGEGHGVTSPANVRDMWTRVEAWFREHLVESGN